MATTITLKGIETLPEPETRALAHIDVDISGVVYDWRVYVPPTVSNWDEYLTANQSKIELDILNKETQWLQLEPKTRVVEQPNFDTGKIETVEVPITREEIVKPTVPDYFALRRAEYPAIGEQLDAVWKGPSHPDFEKIQTAIQAVKTKYPKP